MSSNYRRNKAYIDKYRKDLKAMLDDIEDIDVKVLNKAVNEGVKVAKENTNVVSGFMRKHWYGSPTIKNSKGAVKTLYNIADYAPHVNFGHRLVRNDRTIGYVKGQFMLQKASNKVEKIMVKEFKKEVERVNRKHGK